MPRKNISFAFKNRIAGKQRFKCNNMPGKKIRGLEDYDCPLWESTRQGSFDECGYEIDHIIEHSINENDSENNLQALCRFCHMVKTKKFMMKIQSDVTNEDKICEKNKVEENVDRDKIIVADITSILYKASVKSDTQKIGKILNDKNNSHIIETLTAYIFEVACTNGNIKVIRFLLKHPKVNPAVDNNYPIGCACINGETDIAKILLADSRVDPSANNNEALFVAYKANHIDIMRILLADDRVVKKGLECVDDKQIKDYINICQDTFSKKD